MPTASWSWHCVSFDELVLKDGVFEVISLICLIHISSWVEAESLSSNQAEHISGASYQSTFPDFQELGLRDCVEKGLEVEGNRGQD